MPVATGAQVLSAAERTLILETWNRSPQLDVQGPCLHDLVSAQAERTPEATALIHGTRQLSYRELDTRSSQLAWHLRTLGIGPEVLVGLCFERTPELYIALLAILKCGAAYLPLDPSYPTERIGFMLEDGRCPLVLTRAALCDRLGAYANQALCLDRDASTIAAAQPVALDGLAHAQALAYLIYTSGSTGRPKGVALTHYNATVFLAWAHTLFSPADLAVTLAGTSICFDLSIFEFFAPLSVGGTVVLADHTVQLPELPAADRVTLVNTVPSAMAELLRRRGIPPSVRTVNLAGEPLPNRLAQAVYEQTGATRVFNFYGPSEDTTYSTMALVERGAEHVPPIGRPIAHSQLYILDAALEPVPVGAIGEIYMAGDGLARGYYGRPGLTADRFLPNPFSATPGERMYRTGDLGRFRPDGQVECLGRIDHQVKIRGFRIELGEIEATLDRHPAVREAVVVARELSAGERGLVAYLVPVDAAPAVAELRAFLGRALPDYMLPSLFVALDALPLNPNGKIDRAALPPPTSERLCRDQSFVAPRTPTEQTIAAIWAEVLGLPAVGVFDSFFALGGHSLSAMQIVARMRDAFQSGLPLRQLFETPTVAALAELLATERQLPHGSRPIQPVERDQPLRAAFAQEWTWLLDQVEANPAGYNIPCALTLTGPLDVAALRGCLDELLARHEPLRSSFTLRGGEVFWSFAPPAPLALPVDDLRALPPAERGEAAARLTAEEAARRFDLARGPLLRARLLLLAPDEQILLITMHHIVSDGWSFNMFLDELHTLYGGRVAGQPVHLPPVALSFADFAAWQREYAGSPYLAAQRAYWAGKLAGPLPLPELPADRSRPPVTDGRGALIVRNLPLETAASVRGLCRQEQVTLFMLLLAAYAALLSRYSRQRDLIILVPQAGRNRVETEQMLGFFVDTLALRIATDGDPSFSELLGRVRDTCIEAYANQDVLFEHVLQDLRLLRTGADLPQLQVMFDLEQPPLPGRRLGPLEAHARFTDTGASKLDLTLDVIDEPEGLAVMVEYRTERFDAATIERLIDDYAALLRAVAADPSLRLIEQPLPRPAVMAPAIAPAPPPADGEEARRARLDARRAQLSDAQQALIARRLRGGGRAEPRPAASLVALRSAGTRPPFFCVHPVGGHALSYLALAQELGDTQPFYAFEAPGLTADSQPLTSVEALAAHYRTALQKVQPAGPYRLGGWSLGGAIAFELARQLQAAGESVALLALFDSWAPLPHCKPGVADEPELLRRFAADTGALASAPWGEPDTVRAVLDRGALAAAPPAVQRHFAVYQANFWALQHYSPAPASVPLVLFRAGEEREQPPGDPTLGWRELSRVPPRVVMVPGNHYSMLARPRVSALARALEAHLGAVDPIDPPLVATGAGASYEPRHT